MDQQDRKLLKEIRKILWEEWDPIGVNDCPEAADEYDSYAPEILVLIRRQASKKEIFDYLWYIETVWMCLEGNREKTAQVSRRFSEMAVF